MTRPVSGAAARRGMSHGQWLLLALALTGAILIVHGPVLHAGLFSDDYVVLRPWTRAEIVRTFAGSWDPLNYNDPYHRPLTALYQAALPAVFGARPVLLHAWSFVLVLGAALALARFTDRETGSTRAAALAAFLFALHPALPESSSAWIFRQMALVADLLAVAALLAWQRVRDRPIRSWWPIAVLAAAAFYVKEDGLMVVPAILVLQRLRGAPVRQAAAGSAVLVGALAAIRLAVFPAAASFTTRVDAEHLHELASSVYHVLVRLPGEPAALVADACAVVVLTAALIVFVAGRRRAPSAHAPLPLTPMSGSGERLFLTGAVLLVCFSAPLYFIGGTQRAHLATLASALVFAGAAEMVLCAATNRGRRAETIAAIALVAALIVSFGAAARAANALFAPCSTQTLDGDFYLAEWPGLAPELRTWLSAKRTACETGAPTPPLPLRFVDTSRLPQ